MRRQLPIFDERCLDNVGIANPCDASWEQMKGDDRVRHCPACRLNVYNVSAMTRREAAALIGAREGRLCVKMLKRSDGTLITQDCRERLRQARKRGLVAFAVALTIVCITQLGIRVLGVRALLEWYRAETTTTRMLGAVEPRREWMGEPMVAPMGVMRVEPQPVRETETKPEQKPEPPMMGRASHHPLGAPTNPSPEKPHVQPHENPHVKMGKMDPSTLHLHELMGDVAF